MAKLTSQDLATLEGLGITVYADEGGSVSMGDSSGPYDAVTAEAVKAACASVLEREFVGDEDRPASARRFEAFHDSLAAAVSRPWGENRDRDSVVVSSGIATGYRDGEPVGEWEACADSYAAAGLEWPGCDCCDARDGRECRHGLHHYWGEGWSVEQLLAIARRNTGPQLRHYGVDFAEREIPRFEDGEWCVVEEPMRSKTAYVGGWCWIGQHTGREHSAVASNLVERMMYANLPAWGATEEVARESARLHADAQAAWIAASVAT